MDTQDLITFMCICSICVPIGLILKSVNWIKVKRWYFKTWTKKRIVDFFCNWTERINSEIEVY